MPTGVTMSEFEFEHLADATRDTIVLSGLQFMRSITEAYGSEKGMLLWDTITETLGNDIKGAIFFRLMTGSGDCNVTVLATQTKTAGGSGNFIPYIKAVREYTGHGLKEAKEFCDKTEAGSIGNLIIPFNKKMEFLRALREVGVTAI